MTGWRALLLKFGVGRYLVIKRSWPSGMRTLSGDHARFEATYFNLYPGCAFHDPANPVRMCSC